MKKRRLLILAAIIISALVISLHFLKSTSGNRNQSAIDSSKQSAMSSNRELFVCNKNLKRISVLDPFTNQDIRPLRIIESDSLDSPFGIVVDRVHDEVLVVNDNSRSIAIFSRTAAGHVEPRRLIKGSNTQLNEPTGIAIDASNNEIFVTNYKSNSITVYAAHSDGDIAPKRIIQGPLTKLSGPTGIAINGLDKEILVSNCVLKEEPGYCYITVYPVSGNGDVRPIRELDVITDGYPVAPPGLALDVKRGQLFLTNLVAEGDLADGSSGQCYVSSLSTQSTTSRPLAFHAQAPDLGWGIAFDEENDEIYVVILHGEISVYKVSDSTRAFPTRVITLPGGALYGKLTGSMQETVKHLMGMTGLAIY